MSDPLFNIVEVENIERSDVDLSPLENHLTFPEESEGTDVKVLRSQGRLHIYPHPNSGGSVLTLDSENFRVNSKGKDGKVHDLKVCPFIGCKDKRHYVGLTISIDGTDYILHKIDLADLRDYH